LTDQANERGSVLFPLQPMSREPQHRTLAEARHLLGVRDLMDRRYHEPLDVATLARIACASPGHFSRRFRAAFGEPPHRYLVTRRMEAAQRLLRTSDLSLAEISHAVGFRSLGSFSSRFAQLVGEPPGAYRRRWRDAPRAAEAARIPSCIVARWTRPHRSGTERTVRAGVG
jgi:AraC-like DNA-binding protein